MKRYLITFVTLFCLATTAWAEMPYLNKEKFRALTEGNQGSGGYQEPYDQEDPYQGSDGSQYDPVYDSGYQEQPVCVRPSQRQIEEDRFIARQAFEITGGACDFRSNPHSYACTDLTFQQALFPFFEIDWWGDLATPWNLQGEWIAVTYVESYGAENEGRSFLMKKNPNSPSQPLGVYNRQSGAMGSIWIEGELVHFDNWQGKAMSSRPGSLQIYRHHVLFEMDELLLDSNKRLVDVIHYFECVNFNRHNNMHLQCKWDVKVGKSQRTHMGYFGFLTRPVWESFLTCHKR